MAINTVPQGQVGTGAAQVLQPNRALDNWIVDSKNNAERLRAEQKQFAQKSQAEAQQMNKYLQDIQNMDISPMYRADIQNLGKSLVDRGAQLKAAGLNPWSVGGTPEQQAVLKQFNEDATKIKQASSILKSIDKMREHDLQLYQKDPNSYDPDEFKAQFNFEKENSLEDLVAGNVTFPRLSKLYNIQEAVGKIKAPVKEYQEIRKEGGFDYQYDIKEPDVEKVSSLVENFYAPGTPAYREIDRQMKKKFGDGMDNVYNTTDRAEVKRLLRDTYLSNTPDNPIIEEMRTGNVPSLDSPQFETYLDKKVTEQLEKEKYLANEKEKSFNQIRDSAGGKVDRKLYTEMDRELRARRSESRSAESHNLSQTQKRLNISKTLREISDAEKPANATGSYDAIRFGGGDDKREMVVKESTAFDSGDFMFSPSGSVNKIGESTGSGQLISRQDLPVQSKLRTSRVGAFPVDEKGNLVPVVNHAIEDPKRYRWKVGVLAIDGDDATYVIDPADVSKTLSKPKRAELDKAVSKAQASIPRYTGGQKKTTETKKEETKKSTKPKINW